MLAGVGELYPDVAHIRLPHVLGVEVEAGVHLDVGVLRPLVAGERGEGVEQGFQLFAQQEVAHFDTGAHRQAGVDGPVLGVVVPAKKIGLYSLDGDAVVYFFDPKLNQLIRYF